MKAYFILLKRQEHSEHGVFVAKFFWKDGNISGVIEKFASRPVYLPRKFLRWNIIGCWYHVHAIYDKRSQHINLYVGHAEKSFEFNEKSFSAHPLFLWISCIQYRKMYRKM